MDCIAKTVTCWSHYSWVTMTLYYPQFPKGGIPPEQHPAVIEDSMEFDLDTGKAKHKFKHGKMADAVAHYLRLHGPALVKDICANIGSTPNCVTPMMRRNPQRFEVVDYVIIPDVGVGQSRAAVWGLKEAKN